MKIPAVFKAIITAAVCRLSTGCDWGYWCVLISFVLWKFRDKQILKWALYSFVSLSCVFYPAHLLIIDIILVRFSG